MIGQMDQQVAGLLQFFELILYFKSIKGSTRSLFYLSISSKIAKKKKKKNIDERVISSGLIFGSTRCRRGKKAYRRRVMCGRGKN